MAVRSKREAPKEPEENVIVDEPSEAVNLSGEIGEAEIELARSVAKRMGWQPKEAWTREPAKWVDAPDFLEQTPKLLDSLKERSDRAAAAALATIEEGRRREAQEAEDRVRAAATAGDPEETVRAAKRLAEVSGPPPQTAAWMARNPWFETDPDAKALAISTVNRLAASGTSIGDQLEAAEQSVRRRFPEYFDAGTKEVRLSDVRRQAPAPPAVQQGSRVGASTPKEKGFADIPSADRAHFDKYFKKRGIDPTKYARSYWANKGEAS